MAKGYNAIVLNGITVDAISKQFGKKGLAFFGDRLACYLGRFERVGQDGGMKIYYLQHLNHIRMSEHARMIH